MFSTIFWCSPQLSRGELVMQLAPSSPSHSKACEKDIFLCINNQFIDRRLWKGLNAPAGKPSAIVTGISYGGIGFYTAMHLLLCGVNVHGVARNAQQAERARQLMMDGIQRQCTLHKDWAGKPGRLTIHLCDLCDTSSVCNLADRLLTDATLRVIVCNAGTMCSPLRRTQHGLEEQFAAHFMGHCCLVLRLLQGRMSAAEAQYQTASQLPPWRIVILTSGAASTADPLRSHAFREWRSQEELEAHYSRFAAYGNAKMCELLFALALARFVEFHRALRHTCTVNTLHPGPIRSCVIPNSKLPYAWLLDGEAAALFRMTPVIAALYVVDIALSTRYERTSGHFFRMGEDDTVLQADMVAEAQYRSGFFRNSTLFPGIPGPQVALSLGQQQQLWEEALSYLAAKEYIDPRFFSVLSTTG